MNEERGSGEDGEQCFDFLPCGRLRQRLLYETLRVACFPVGVRSGQAAQQPEQRENNQ
ncbi:hypothetical protein GS682_01935 [Nostoc sp. B(2019)]|nr:hypothetical protein [Nostoc sp. B(2019)]